MSAVHVLYINGKMYGFHLGTCRVEAIKCVEQKAAYLHPDTLYQLEQNGRFIASYYLGQWLWLN